MLKCLYASKEKIIFVLGVPSISQKLKTKCLLFKIKCELLFGFSLDFLNIFNIYSTLWIEPYCAKRLKSPLHLPLLAFEEQLECIRLVG